MKLFLEISLRKALMTVPSEYILSCSHCWLKSCWTLQSVELGSSIFFICTLIKMTVEISNSNFLLMLNRNKMLFKSYNCCMSMLWWILKKCDSFCHQTRHCHTEKKSRRVLWWLLLWTQVRWCYNKYILQPCIIYLSIYLSIWSHLLICTL